MASKVIFLSHIHKEQKLAMKIKDALEAEFSGFVDVFVSSDDTSIPKGFDFLDSIREALTMCIGSMFLISPQSIQSRWMSFELGAIFMRNHLSEAKTDKVSAIPLCHSGMPLGNLPAPLSSMNGSDGSNSNDLRKMFLSLQAAAGSKVPLRTDFDALATEVAKFQTEYMFGANARKLLSLLGTPSLELRKALTTGVDRVSFNCIVEPHILGEVRSLISSLSSDVTARPGGLVALSTDSGNISGTGYELTMSRRAIDAAT